MLGAKKIVVGASVTKGKGGKKGKKNENNVVSFVVAPLLTVEKEYK